MADAMATVVIVDDEQPARAILREFVAADPRFRIVAECDGGAAAEQAIRGLRPDVVLLDVQMPEVDGFDVLTRLPEPLPLTIMVTAFHEHALRAFDFHALDYVLKPIEEERLRQALDRALARIAECRPDPPPNGLRDLVGALRGEVRQDHRIVLKSASSVLFLEPDELPWIEAAGNYLKVAVAGRTHLVRESMQALLERLDSVTFVRIHRSFAVNRNAVAEIRAQPGGSDYLVVLRGGQQLPIGRSYRKSVLDRLDSGQ